MNLDINYEELIQKALGVLYPDPDDRKTAERQLQTYGTESYHQEIPRVRLGILYFASKDSGRIANIVNDACVDFRDLLCWAEYPHSSPKWNLKKTHSRDYQKLEAKEQQEYLDWISSIREA